MPTNHPQGAEVVWSLMNGNHLERYWGCYIHPYIVVAFDALWISALSAGRLSAGCRFALSWAPAVDHFSIFHQFNIKEHRSEKSFSLPFFLTSFDALLSNGYFRTNISRFLYFSCCCRTTAMGVVVRADPLTFLFVRLATSLVVAEADATKL